MGCSLPGSSVHGIFQARVLERVAISFSRGSSQPRDRTWVSHIAGRPFTIWATRQAGIRWQKKHTWKDAPHHMSSRKCKIKQQWDTTSYPCVLSRSVLSDYFDPVDCSTAGFPVLHYLLEFAETHVHWVGDAIQLYNTLEKVKLCRH